MLPSEGTCEPGASFRRPAQGRPSCLIHTSTRAVAEPSTQLQIASRPRYANRHRFGQPTWRYGFALTNTRTGNSRRACALSPLIDAQARTLEVSLLICGVQERANLGVGVRSNPECEFGRI